jgi:RNA polymerase sigma-70 factor (ECF subfamily)
VHSPGNPETKFNSDRKSQKLEIFSDFQTNSLTDCIPETVSTNEQARFSIRLRRCADDLRQQGVAALGELYDLAAPRLVRYALMLTRNQHDAEDAPQAAILRIARNSMTLGASKHPWAYFIKVVRNEALKIIQQRKSVSSSAVSAAAANEDPFMLESLELAESVRHALHKLPTTQSEVVVLKIWENMALG